MRHRCRQRCRQPSLAGALPSALPSAFIAWRVAVSVAVSVAVRFVTVLAVDGSCSRRADLGYLPGLSGRHHRHFGHVWATSRETKIDDEPPAKYGIKLNPEKCRLFQLKTNFPGHVVSRRGSEPDPEKVKAVVEWPTPGI